MQTTALKRMLTGNKAAAWGARLAGVEYVPAFPITPQTEIVETLSTWFADGTLRGKFTNMDSEHSMFMAAGAAAATGVRVFTASSSQGILHGLESIYTVTGWRVPFVLVNVSRALATPITLEPDHNDVMATRDCGMVQLHAETCQEVLDFILLAFRIAESPDVCLPVLVNMDGFYLSFTREPVLIPDEAAVRAFLPEFEPVQPVFQASRPMARAGAVFGGGPYTYFRIQQELAARKAETVFAEAAQEYGERFGRYYDTVERFQLDDADYAFVMSNSFATQGKAAVRRLRSQGVKAGLLKISMFRPFPAQAIAEALRKTEKIAVIDQNLAPGMGGIMYPEIVTALANGHRPAHKVLSVIGGLGGKNLREEDFLSIVAELDAPVPRTPLFLYDENDWNQFQNLLKLAHSGKEAS